MTRLLLIAFVALTACAPVYVPNLRNSPMFTKAGEFQASVHIGNGIEAQSAFAVSDHFGVMANYAYIDQSGQDAPEDYHRHRFFEGGVGYYTNRDDSFFEVFAGYGRGKGTSYDKYEFLGGESIAATGAYERYFLQPAFGLNKDIMHFAFVPRVSMVDFYQFSNEVVSASLHEAPKFFFEPALVGRVNFAANQMFFTFQTGASLGMSRDVYFDRRTFQVAIGLGMRLGGARALVSRQ